jgi:hypothetical protein
MMRTRLTGFFILRGRAGKGRLLRQTAKERKLEPASRSSKAGAESGGVRADGPVASKK